MRFDQLSHAIRIRNLTACMGGFCEIRERCARHTSANTATPRERICPPASVRAFVPNVAPPTPGRTT